jgi:hypothetical protein
MNQNNLFILVIAAFSIFGCSSQSDPEEHLETLTGEVANYTLHVKPQTNEIEIVGTKDIQTQPSLSQQVFTDVSLQQDGVPGSGPPNTVELVTNSVTNTFGIGPQGNCSYNSFCASITLNSFWTRYMTNVYVVINSVRDGYGTSANNISGHDGNNSDSPPSNCNSSSNCPSAKHGLWRYTQSGYPLGVLAANGSATSYWSFDNPDNADAYINISVVATLSYQNYTIANTYNYVTNACTSGGAVIPNVATNATIKLPFLFTFYDVTSSSLKITKYGQFSFVSSNFSPNNVAIPNPTAPKPAGFVFWDDITYGSSATNGMSNSNMCWKIIGGAPNRTAIVTWSNMTFGSTASLTEQNSKMTFSVAFHESTDQIDYFYENMSGPSRANGSTATVGAQDSSGSTSAVGSTYKNPVFVSGKFLTLTPVL